MNLGLVLSALNLAPFEPAEEVDLKFLSYKCCFSLALASGRRLSEVHSYAREIVLYIQVEMVLTERLETPFLIGIKSLLLVLERKETI
jgi:hypothetical protein